MTQKEFLDTLYEQLSDQIPDAKASAHTQYYQEYIRNEIRNGKNEQDVLHSLARSPFNCENTDPIPVPNLILVLNPVRKKYIILTSQSTAATAWIFPPGMVN